MMLILLIGVMEIQWADRLLDFPSPRLMVKYQEELTTGGATYEGGFPTSDVRKATSVGSPEKMTYEHVYRTLFHLSQLSDRALGVIAMRFDIRNVRIDQKNAMQAWLLAEEMESRAGVLMSLLFVEPGEEDVAGIGWVREGKQLRYAQQLRNAFTPMNPWQSYQAGRLVKRKVKRYDEKGIYYE